MIRAYALFVGRTAPWTVALPTQKCWRVAGCVACASPSSAVVTDAIAYARFPSIYRVLQDTLCSRGTCVHDCD